MPVYIRDHNAVFIHIPKTGGTTVSKFIFQEFGRDIMKVNGAKPGHIGARWIEKDMFRFSFVRNPISWWESVWKMCASMKKEDFWRMGYQPLGIVAPFWDKDFNKFMERVIKFTPGFYCEMLTWYLGKDLNGLEFIGRTQYLKADLYTAFEKMGADIDRKKIEKMKTYGARKQSVKWDRDIENKIIVLEKAYYERFR